MMKTLIVSSLVALALASTAQAKPMAVVSQNDLSQSLRAVFPAIAAAAG
jgi:hypothetical protein